MKIKVEGKRESGGENRMEEKKGVIESKEIRKERWQNRKRVEK